MTFRSPDVCSKKTQQLLCCAPPDPQQSEPYTLDAPKHAPLQTEISQSTTVQQNPLKQGALTIRNQSPHAVKQFFEDLLLSGNLYFD